MNSLDLFRAPDVGQGLGRGRLQSAVVLTQRGDSKRCDACGVFGGGPLGCGAEGVRRGGRTAALGWEGCLSQR